jgi:hypothetical protein
LLRKDRLRSIAATERCATKTKRQWRRSGRAEQALDIRHRLVENPVDLRLVLVVLYV